MGMLIMKFDNYNITFDCCLKNIDVAVGVYAIDTYCEPAGATATPSHFPIENISRVAPGVARRYRQFYNGKFSSCCAQPSA